MSLEWIEGVPADWHISKAQFVLDYQKRDVQEDDEIVTAFRDGQVTLRRNRRTDGFTMAEKEIGYQHICEGDLVVHSMDGGFGAIGVSDSCGKASPVVHAYTSSLCDLRFVAYQLRAAVKAGWIAALAKGIRVRSTQFDRPALASLNIAYPTVETQQRIADYLDRETAEIDAAVADLDRYVKLLEKRGKVLIEKTVNGGTNSFSPLWSKIRVQNGFAFDSEKFSPTKELPVAKIGNVLPGDFSEFIDASELPSESFLIKDGDLVVGMSGDFNRTIWNKGKAALNQRVCILKPIADDDIRYINYAIGSGLKKIHSTKFSTTLKNLSTEEILAIRVPHRTVTEQKEIATYLDKETAEINDLVVESTRLRDLLLKRRSVLITEVITGRKQV